jgi:hypothetical protein
MPLLRYRCYSWWILAALSCGFIFLFGAVSSNNTSLAYSKSTPIVVTPSPTEVVTATLVRRPPPTVVAASQPPSHLDLSFVIAILGLTIAGGGLLIQGITLYFIIKYVRDTATMAEATRDSAKATQASAKVAENTLKEMQEARDEENRPFVVVYFEIPTGKPLIYLIIKNVGKSIATNIKMKFTPSLSSAVFKEINDRPLIKDGISSLPPDYEIRTFFDSTIQRFGNADFPFSYTVELSYCGGLIEKQREDKQVLDLSAFYGLLYSTQNDMNDLVKEVKSLVSEYKDTNKALKVISESLKDGLYLKNPEILSVNFTLQVDSPLAYIIAKLRKFMDNWKRAYTRQDFYRYAQEGENMVNRGENLVSPYNSQIHDDCIFISNNISAMLSINEASISKELAGRIANVATNLAQLGNLEAYDYGHDYPVEFNEMGNSLVKDIEDILKLVETQGITTLADHNDEHSTTDSTSS